MRFQGPQGRPSLWGRSGLLGQLWQPGLHRRDRQTERRKRTFVLSFPGALGLQNGVKYCPNGSDALFSKMGPHVSESVYVSPMFRLGDMKGTFCPESKCGTISHNWL